MAKLLYESKIGTLCIEEQNDSIVSLELFDGKQIEEDHDNEILNETKKQLDEYFAGTRNEFTVPFALEGTDYFIKVWKQLLKIPYGKTYTYGQIAEMAGNKKGARSAGMACGKNKIMIIVPCHRVIGANGKLTGFAGGLDVKEKLLLHEKKFNK